MKKLIVCSESTYTSIDLFINHENSIEVISYGQSFFSKIRKEDFCLVSYVDVIQHFIQYDDVYIFTSSLNEGIELTLFFSEIGMKMIFVVTQNKKYIQLYKKAGAKIVMITKPGEDAYSWLHRIV